MHEQQEHSGFLLFLVLFLGLFSGTARTTEYPHSQPHALAPHPQSNRILLTHTHLDAGQLRDDIRY